MRSAIGSVRSSPLNENAGVMCSNVVTVGSAFAVSDETTDAELRTEPPRHYPKAMRRPAPRRWAVLRRSGVLLLTAVAGPVGIVAETGAPPEAMALAVSARFGDPDRSSDQIRVLLLLTYVGALVTAWAVSS
jgi:hypothetical protein